MSPILFRLISRLYVAVFALVLAGVALVYLVADFSDRLNIFLEHSASDVAQLYWNKALVAVHQLGPAAMLLSGGVTVSLLRRKAEWVAMQALGASRWTVVAPIATAASIAAVGFVAFDELVATKAGERVDHLMANRFGRWGDYAFFYFPKQWFRVGSDIVHVRGGIDEQGALKDVTVYRLGPGFSLAARIDADALASLGADRWQLAGASERRFDVDGASTLHRDERRELVLTGSDPRTFRVRNGRPEQMSLGDLAEQRVIRARVGLPVQRFFLATHNRFAYPVTGVAAALLAVSLALRPARRGHLTLALIEGLLVSVVLFAFMLMGKALVLAEHVSPWVAAWAPAIGLTGLAFGLWGWAEGQLRPSARR